MSSGAIALLIASIGQTIAVVIGVFKLGKWIEKVNTSLFALDKHITSDDMLHKKLQEEINDLKIKLASREHSGGRRSGDDERNEERNDRGDY